MTPSARAYLDAYGIPADSIEGREIAGAFAAHELPSNVIHLPTITSARLAAERAARAFDEASVGVAHDIDGEMEAGTAPGSASDAFDLGLRIVAVLAVLGVMFMAGGMLVDAETAYRLAGRV